jgi:hypothetical protein
MLPTEGSLGCRAAITCCPLVVPPHWAAIMVAKIKRGGLDGAKG